MGKGNGNRLSVGDLLRAGFSLPEIAKFFEKKEAGRKGKDSTAKPDTATADAILAAYGIGYISPKKPNNTVHQDSDLDMSPKRDIYGPRYTDAIISGLGELSSKRIDGNSQPDSDRDSIQSSPDKDSIPRKYSASDYIESLPDLFFGGRRRGEKYFDSDKIDRGSRRGRSSRESFDEKLLKKNPPLNEYIIPIYSGILGSQLNEKKIINSLDSSGPIFKNQNFIEKISLKNIDYSQVKIDKIFGSYSKVLTNSNKTSYGLNVYLNPDAEQITADNVGAAVLPLVEYIHEMQPDYIVASDRGARVIGAAVAALYHRLYGKLPTVDGTLRFRRFSKSNSIEETEAYIRPLVQEMTAAREKPRVLVLDDWVASGRTKEIIDGVFSRLSNGSIDVKYGVLLGDGADVSGKPHNGGFAGSVDWRDSSPIFGVDYDGTKVHTVSDGTSTSYRQRMYAGIDKLVQSITQDVIDEARKAAGVNSKAPARFSKSPEFEYAGV